MMDNEVLNTILSRTSVRRFLAEKPVPADNVKALLRAGMSAPSGVNKQPWEFIVVDDAALLQRLADALPYAKMAAQAPMAIVLCGNSDRFLDGVDSTLWVQDLSAVSENILLAAHALGLGGVWTCLYPHADRMKAVGDILNISAGVVPFNLIPIGYPAHEHAPIDKWRPSCIHHNRY